MPRVMVPVRFPLTRHSRATLEAAIEEAEASEGELNVLHVNLYQSGRTVTRSALRRAVEREFGRLPNARYVVRRGFLVEETILTEVAATGADVVVIGHKQAGRWRRMVRTLVDDPDIESYLRDGLDIEVITVGPSGVRS